MTIKNKKFYILLLLVVTINNILCMNNITYLEQRNLKTKPNGIKIAFEYVFNQKKFNKWWFMKLEQTDRLRIKNYYKNSINKFKIPYLTKKIENLNQKKWYQKLNNFQIKQGSIYSSGASIIGFLGYLGIKNGHRILTTQEADLKNLAIVSSLFLGGTLLAGISIPCFLKGLHHSFNGIFYYSYLNRKLIPFITLRTTIDQAEEYIEQHKKRKAIKAINEQEKEQ